MTTTSTVAPSAQGAPEQTGLFDADGHVMEDVHAIVAKLPDKWRVGRERLLKNDLSRLHGMSIFPPLGYLSTIPTPGRSMLGRGPRETGLDPESWEFFLGEVGIERTVLYPTLGLTVGRLRDPEYAVAITRAYNDWMAETYIRHPSGKFQAAALLPLQVPSEAVKELRRVVDELGFRAAVLPAHGLHNHLGSEMFFPVYEAAEDLDVGLSCHGGIHDGFGFDDFNVFGAIHALGFPFGLLISLGGMLFNNVFERFPGLRVAFLEGGAAWILMAAERFSESFGATPSLWSDALHLPEGTSVRHYLSDLMKAGRIVIGCEGGEHHLVTAMEYFGCAPFMYSSDFPHEVNVKSCLHELEELNELPIDAESRGLLRGGTARKFYKL
jgi:predicted TIM-barrel fold metal-dependent hydrolase